tara:strand:+ start:367 stop:906 length:540 start_codon:yes stop_codon:yes gene_type:complete
MNKKAIALSINFLVVIIISLVVFGSGIAFLYKLMGSAEEYKKTLDSKTEEQLRRLLVDQGQKVALPTQAVYTEPGKVVSFGIGILNILEKNYGTKFKIKVSPSIAVDEKKKKKLALPGKEWLLYISGPYVIKENDHKMVPIGIVVPKTAKKGTYIFNAQVLDENGKIYDNIKKFNVVVK